MITKKKNRILKTTDLFIQASRTEGMPLGILEALSFQIPCIITEGTSLSEIVQKFDCGWTSKTNYEDLSETIKKAVSDVQFYKKRGTNALKCIICSFDWDSLTDLTIKQYELVIKKMHLS